ncbi:choice-of-anchor L domain-containing protein [Flavobacterium sp. SUN046]|uniref:choice-of-anchor L domain-containing protein n=1 Tax=Flavobacterium sp. SUN046 TaxID=3002440 RepID=UPI002DC01908|nr:choice-of-anchor L domain-containing protein [Flavobacterium sp. SUN046]MEC4051054.1 choice-of-anchor L domain-containing protein [Flavobacterium sp. SUN046]
MEKQIILMFALFFSLAGFAQLTEGFEGTIGPDALPSNNWSLSSGNWAVFDNNVGTIQRWKINTTSTNVHGGANAAYLQNEYIGIGTTSEDYLATPLVTIPVNGILRFWTRTIQSGDQGTMYYFMINSTSGTQNTLANYTTVQQWTENSLNTSYNVYEEKIVDLSAYAGQQVYMAFMMSYNQPTASLGGDRWLLDDIKFDQQCLPITIATTNQLSITSTTASISWNDPNDASSWEIEIVPFTETFTGIGTVISTNPYTATSLIPSTLYKYRIKSLCSETNSSVWQEIYLFTTTITPIYCGAIFTDSGGATGNYGNQENTPTLICPSSPIDIVKVTFSKFRTRSPYDILTVYDGSNSTNPLIGSFTGNLNNALPGPIVSTVPGGCLYFVFTSDYASVREGWIADVSCEPAHNCTRPTTVSAGIVLSTTANIGWTQLANPDSTIPSSWQIIALPCGSEAPNDTTTAWTAAPTNPFTMTGLSPDTCYDYYVRAVCSSSENSNWSLKTISTTQVIPPICGESFMDPGGADGNYPSNSTSTVTICPINPGDQVTVTFSEFNIQSGWDGLFVYNGNSIFSPQIPSTNGNIPGGPSGSFWGTGIPPPFTSTSPDGCLTFKLISYVIDTFSGWNSMVSCAPPPTCVKPIILYNTNITATTASLTWTQEANPDNSIATAWEIIALPCGSITPTASATGWTAAPTNPFILTGLSPISCYDFYVRAVCSGTDSSVWSVKTTGTTVVTPPVCGGYFTDNGGLNTNYPTNSNTTVTICPVNPNDQVTVTFTAFNVETNWDALYVFDGNSTNAPLQSSGNPAANVPGGLAGGYWGTNLPGPFTASNPTGCLTFNFRSDALVTDPGWNSVITCAPAPSCPKPSITIVDSITHNTATVSWTNNNSATSWQVLLLPASAPTPIESTTGWILTTTNPYSFTGLTIGTSYAVYVRAICSDSDFSLWSSAFLFNTTFRPPISTSTSLYTTQQLVEEVLISASCSSVSNITSSSGNNFTNANGIGYFNQNDSSFPFADGIILTTGAALAAPGPNTYNLNIGNNNWPGDADLDAIIFAVTGVNVNSKNASILEFDFIPTMNNLSFNFLFASEEYGIFQCDFSDAFAFLLTDIASGVTTNLAVVPNTTTPISVVTIRDALFNNSCPSINENYFGNYYLLPLGLNPLADPTNFNGLTKPMTASSSVIPGNQYHIKIVIADRNDGAYDSAVFIQGGSFNIGSINLGSNLLVATNNALCNNTTYTLQTELAPAFYSFVWSLNGIPIVGETGPNLIVSAAGHYQVVATYINTICFITSTIDVEYYSPVVLGTPNNLLECSATGFALFDLTQNNTSTLGTLNPANFTITYYASQLDANNGTNPLALLFTNTTAYLQTIYVRVTQNSGTCYATSQFNLTTSPSTASTFIMPVPICANATAPILPTISQNGFTGSWEPALVNNTQTAIYTFIPTPGQCALQSTITVVVNQPIQATFSPITAICNGNALALPVTSNEGFTGSWSPAVNNTITTLYTFIPTIGLCALANTLTVVVNQPIQATFNPIAAICNGDLFVLPINSNEGFTGSWSPAVNNTVTTLYTFTPTIGLCAVANTMTVVVNQPVQATFNPIAAICNGDNLVLPITSNEGFTGSWSPAVNNTITTLYTFIPTIGLCAVANTMTVVVNQPVQATFNPIAAICNGDALALPVNPNEGFTGTWSPAVNNTVTTLYTFTPAIGLCAIANTMTVVVNQPVQATFNPIAAICNGDVLVLPINSNEGFTGNWSPAVNNTVTTLYTFTPAIGLCAVANTMTVVVNQPVQATFNPIAAICNGDALVLPINSNEGFTGSWSPVVNNTVTTLYTFTPTIGLCAAANTLTVVVNQPIQATFNPIAAICKGDVLALPINSNEGFTGSWSPVVNNTVTTLYTFTPTIGLCAAANTLTVVVNQPIQATFNPIAAICKGDVLALPINSNEGFTGSWSPAVNNTVTTLYTFTPTIGLCAAANTLTAVVNQPIQATFNPIAAICNGDVLALPINSNEGFIGSWSPAVNNTVTTNYSFTPTSGQCAAISTVIITVNQKTTPTFNSISSLCIGGTAPILPLISINGYNGIWSPSFIDNTQSATYTFTPASGQCATTATLSVIVQAAFDFELTDGCLNNIFMITVVPTNGSFDASMATYSWQVGGVIVSNAIDSSFNATNYVNTTIPSPSLPINVGTTVTTSQGCIKSHSIAIERTYCEIQRGISPNNDGKNDFLDLRLMNVSNLEIINRYGIKVYSRTDYANQWVGQDLKGNDLPDGTYFYMIEFNNNQSPKTGWIYINKEDR